MVKRCSALRVPTGTTVAVAVDIFSADSFMAHGTALQVDRIFNLRWILTAKVCLQNSWMQFISLMVSSIGISASKLQKLSGCTWAGQN